MTLIRHFTLNLLTQKISLKIGKKAKRLRARWDNVHLAKFLAA